MNRLGTLLTIALLLAAQTAAQEESQPQDLATLRAKAADASLDQEQRQAATDNAIDLRREMLAADAFGQNAAKIQIEQAAAILARLGRDGADTAVLFALALPEQRARVANTAKEATQLLAEATDQIRLDIARIDRIPLNDLTDEQEEGQWVMRYVDLGARVPFFAGRASLLMAATASTPTDRAQHAQNAINALQNLNLSDPGADVARLINIATARLARGGAQNRQLARGEFILAAQQAQADPAIPTIIKAEASFGLLTIATDSEEAMRLASRTRAKIDEMASGENPLLTILAADAITRALAHAARSPDGRWDPIALGRAFAAQTNLQTRTDLGIEPELINALVMEKMGALVQTGMPLDVIPLEALYAKAIALARAPTGRAEAITLLTRVIEKAQQADLRNNALQAKAAALSTSPNPQDRFQAAQSLLSLSRKTGGTDRSVESLHAALTLIRPLLENESLTQARTLYIEALDRATSIPNIQDRDTWRYERARLIVQDMGPQQDHKTHSDALALLIRIPKSAPVHEQAAALIAHLYTTQINDAWNKLQSARQTGDENEAKRIAAAQILPAARTALAWAEQASKPHVVQFLMDLADARTEEGDRRARYVYERLLEKETIPPSSLTRVRFGYARALLLEKKPEEAFAILLEITQQLESQTPQEFWHAWTLILETLQQQGDERAAAATTHIKRLKALDEKLGGKPWSQRIAAVEQWAN